MADTKVKIACWLYGRRHRSVFAAARPLEGNLPYMGPDERYWWGYKYYFGPIEREEPGSGLEEHFRRQDLDLAPRDGFAESAGMTLCAGGDLMAYPGLSPRTTGALWDEVRDFFFSGDLACANLESPIVPSAPPSYIPKSILLPGLLNNTPEMFDRITDGGRGVGLFSTANNHCLDMGEAGLRETLDFLDARGYPHVGTSRSVEERDKVTIVERNGVKVAFVSFTFGLNAGKLPEGREYLANYVRLNKPDADISPLARQVVAAREAGADAVVALLHWGLEFETYPASNVVEMGHRVARIGVDIVVGNHAHNAQPIERYSCRDPSSGRAREALILYALGDLLSIHRTLPDSRLACLARMRISRGQAGGVRGVRVTSLEVMPVYLYVKKRRGECVDYRVLDFRRLAGELHAGTDRFGLGRRRAREVFRLEALMDRILGPALARHSRGSG